MIKYHRSLTIGFLIWGACLWMAGTGPAHALQDIDLTRLIQDLKKDVRGPYQAIKWFCPDGRILPANERCEEPKSLQHGLLKDPVRKLEKDRNIYLDLILSGLAHERIWDADSRHSRIKQYALIQYLFQRDDGWIYNRARYYRGAIQAENESAWGESFLTWLLSDPKHLSSQFFLTREACRTIPHPDLNKNRFSAIRAISLTLSEQIPEFMPLRVKLHGRPESKDLASVNAFIKSNKSRLDDSQNRLFQSLVDNLEAVYAVQPDAAVETLASGPISRIPQLSRAVAQILESVQQLRDAKDSFQAAVPYTALADLLLEIRILLPAVEPKSRLSLMNFSLAIERMLFSSIGAWQPVTVAELVKKAQVLATAAAGCGYLERWELASAESYGFKDLPESIDFKEFRLMAEQIRRTVDWGSLMVRSTYLPEITLFSEFEPLADGFVDDRIRESILLPMGEVAGQLTRFIQTSAGITHTLPDTVLAQGVRGLNPGIAYGTLKVVQGDPGLLETDAKTIYAFNTVPSEIKPVAGMLTVSEGNLVSHVQLLARNLGIPNAVITTENLTGLEPFSGKKMFYAVSQRGAVVLKPESLLTDLEKKLIQGKKRSLDMFSVPVEQIDLTKNTFVPLNQVRAIDSGRICGPKAANLGQLKSLFPEQVVDGIVIPFGMFRDHMDQQMPGQEMTYWQFLTQALSSQTGNDAERISTLSTLQAAIQTIPFLPDFETHLVKMFKTTFNDSIGNVPVFIRSDTNMEDMPNFTGAGLNLTVFNVREKEKILQGIRDVWASPYSDRSYLWRQKYLKNPENVFPSILLLPTVNVEKSGVIITHGIVSNQPEDITVAFNQGAGGAVSGQAAESYLLTGKDTDILLYPAREGLSITLPAEGGTKKQALFVDQPILTREERHQIRELVQTVRTLVAKPGGIEGKGPFDIELGFMNGALYLFQIRPFVENKTAGTLNYLLSLDPMETESKTISPQQALMP